MPSTAMHPRVSLNEISSFNWSFDQDMALYRELGLRSIGLLYPKLRDNKSGGIDASVKAVRESGFQLSCMATDRCNLVGVSPEVLAANHAALRAALDAAAAMSCPACYIVSGPTPPRMPTDDAYAEFIRAVAPVVAYAKQKGVRLGLEHNSTSTRDNGFVHTLADAAWLYGQCGLEICLELQNCWMERDLKRIFRDNMQHVCVVQVSDYKVGEPLRYNRRALGDGDIPLEWLLGALLDAGYKGIFDIEMLGPKIEEEGYASSGRRSVEWLSERMARWGA
jgi:sugar phosphate isomerase/epimerase